MKRSVPVIVGFVSGALVILKYFWTDPTVSRLGSQVVSWRTIVAAFALGLGAVNLIQSHLKNVVHKGRNWDASVMLLLSLLGFTVIGVWKGTGSPMYRWGFEYLYQPVYSGIASLLAFMITSASYRAFRLKDWQSSLLMAAAVLVMLGQIGIGSLIYKGIPSWSQWLMRVPNTAGIRGITIGGALGAMALSLRVLLGLERSYLGGGEQ